MKVIVGMLILAVALLPLGCGKKEAVSPQRLSGSITLSGAFALYPMAVKWAEEFQRQNPGVQVDVQAGGAGKGMADVLAGLVDIGMVSREVQPVEVEKGAWSLPVAKDGVVAVINAANPLVEAIRSRGLLKAKLQALWLEGKFTTWEELLGIDKKGVGKPIHLYTRSDACGAAETWAVFLGKKQEDLKGVGVFGDPGLALAVRNDALGIGYNNINFAYDPNTRRPLEGLEVAALDLDGNGAKDAGEDFYGNRDQLVQAVSDGRYPSPPARDLYFVCLRKPQKEALKAFLEWVLTEGQKMLPEGGYVAPAAQKIERGLVDLRR